jgi:hypothetical protein
MLILIMEEDMKALNGRKIIKKQHGKRKRKWEDNTKIYFREKGCDSAYYVFLIHNRDQ